MTTHEFKPIQFYNTFTSHPAVLMINSGDVIATTLLDAHGKSGEGDFLSHAPNPLTGPFFINGAEPGDSIVIEINKLLPNRIDGWSYDVLKLHLLELDLAISLPARKMIDWTIDKEKQSVTLKSDLDFLSLLLSPVLGCIGVAPAMEEAITSYTCGNFGGNMDYQGIIAGVKVILPVFVPGALLFMGDGHACQSSGEITGSGVETSFDIQVSVKTRKKRQVFWPRVESEDYLITLGNAQPLEKAIRAATSEMFRWLKEDWDLDLVRSSQLLSQIIEYEPGNLVSREFTMACKVPKKYLPGAVNA